MDSRRTRSIISSVFACVLALMFLGGCDGPLQARTSSTQLVVVSESQLRAALDGFDATPEFDNIAQSDDGAAILVPLMNDARLAVLHKDSVAPVMMTREEARVAYGLTCNCYDLRGELGLKITRDDDEITVRRTTDSPEILLQKRYFWFRPPRAAMTNGIEIFTVYLYRFSVDSHFEAIEGNEVIVYGPEKADGDRPELRRFRMRAVPHTAQPGGTLLACRGWNGSRFIYDFDRKRTVRKLDEDELGFFLCSDWLTPRAVGTDARTAASN